MTLPTTRLGCDDAGWICPAEFVLAWHVRDPETTDLLGGFYGGDFAAEVILVAEAINEYQREHDVAILPVNLSLTPNYSADDGYFGIDTAVRIDHPSASEVYLSCYRNLDEFITDRDATGLAAALAIAKALVTHSYALAEVAAVLSVTI